MIAQYGSTVSWPTKTWPQWSLWQYTDRATVDGITGPVDGNKWNGSEEALVAWLSPAGQAPAPSPEPQTEPITMTIPVGQRLIVNGKEIALWSVPSHH